MIEAEWRTTDQFRAMAAALAPHGRGGARMSGVVRAALLAPPVGGLLRGLGGLFRAAAERLFDVSPRPPLRVVASDRRSRLLAAACWRHVWVDLGAPTAVPGYETREAWTELIERFADGTQSAQDAAVVRLSMSPHVNPLPLPDMLVGACVSDHTQQLWTLAALADALPGIFGATFPPQSRLGCDLIRDLFGVPHRQVPFADAWRTSTAVGVARGVYDDGAFDRMPILADALEDAGCDDAEVLAHCRGEGLHVRGCWVVDRVLGKE